jgi:hypothetical protein
MTRLTAFQQSAQTYALDLYEIALSLNDKNLSNTNEF